MSPSDLIGLLCHRSRLPCFGDDISAIWRFVFGREQERRSVMESRIREYARVSSACQLATCAELAKDAEIVSRETRVAGTL